MPILAEKKNIKSNSKVTLFVIVGWSDTALTPVLMKEHRSTVGQARKKEKGERQLCSLTPKSGVNFRRVGASFFIK